MVLINPAIRSQKCAPTFTCSGGRRKAVLDDVRSAA